jgi:hypothetical protein
VSVATQALERAAKAGERWAAIMEKQENKMELKTTRVTVKNVKEDFMILIADTSSMDDEVKAVHMLFLDAILKEMGLRRAPATSSMSAPPDQQTTSPPDLGATQPPPDVSFPFFV